MTVVRLPSRDCREVAALLSRLLKLALANRLDRVAVTFGEPGEPEDSALAGLYARDERQALKASLRHSWGLTQRTQPPPTPTARRARKR